MPSLPAPLRWARAIALFQGWAAGLGVLVMLGVAVVAAGGLRNGAFVALALLFLAGDVLAVSCAIVIAARRLTEAAAWARVLLDVVEGVTIAVGLVAVLLGSGVLGLLGIGIGVAVITLLHMPSCNALFAGQPLVPWEVQPGPEPHGLPAPEFPRRSRMGAARPLGAAESLSPVPAPPAWQVPRRTGRYSWETVDTHLLEAPPVASPPPAFSAGAEPSPPSPAPVPLLTPPVVPPPDDPPLRPFVVPPLERLTESPRHAGTPGAEPEAGPVVRPFVVPDPEEPGGAPSSVDGAPAAAVPAPPPPATPEPGAWEPRELPPVAAATALPPDARARAGVATVDHRVSSAPARRDRRAAPAPPTWGWRKVVIAASLLGAIGGGVLSAVELAAGGGGRLPDTGQAPLAPNVPPVQQLPRQVPHDQRSEPASAGGVGGVTLTPEGACSVGGSCAVTVRVDLEPHQDELVAWSIVVVDRCSSQRVETQVTGIPAPGSYRYVLSTNSVTIPAWRSPQILAVTTSPARASSASIPLAGTGGC